MMASLSSEPQVLEGQHTIASVTDQITADVLEPPLKLGWLAGFLFSFVLLMVFITAVAYLLLKGIGIWGVNIPVAWGFAITNFVWWIGIGHAGTFISAFLYLMRQEWRNSISRFAEAMTIFAVACAGLMPLLHLGRPWFFYWLFPYPDTMDLWPQFRSPLVWDVFAVSTYLTVSLVYWYIGMVPDLASMRDNASHPGIRTLYGILALGWRGSAKHWQRYKTAYLMLAGLATPLVISVHSVVSLDFSASLVPGWHSTIFPPYFVAGAIFSGFAMVLTLGIPLRKFYKLEKFITILHLENCAKLLLVTGLIVTYSYAMEDFMAWYSGNKFEKYVVINRALGHYWPLYWILVAGNVITPQFLWFKKIRTSPAALFIISIIVNIGMWIERYVIVITSLHRDFMPSAWHVFSGTFWDQATLFGSMGLFVFLFLLFVRTLPSISIFELRELVHQKSSKPQTSESKASTCIDPSRMAPSRTYGLLAEFESAENLLPAVRETRAAGYRRIDAFSPFPLEGLSEAIGFTKDRVPLLTFIGGAVGGLSGYLMQWYANVIDYPINVGGRPMNSWPAFIIITFEMTILGAALTTVIGMIRLNRLPKLYHPVFTQDRFSRASKDRFFLCIQSSDPLFDPSNTAEFLQNLRPKAISEVPREI